MIDQTDKPAVGTAATTAALIQGLPAAATLQGFPELPEASFFVAHGLHGLDVAPLLITAAIIGIAAKAMAVIDSPKTIPLPISHGKKKGDPIV